MGGPLLGSAFLPELARDSRAWGASEVDPGPFPKRLIDARGGLHFMGKAPTRIVSNVLAADEILLELVDPRRLAGVTYLVDDPTSTEITAPPVVPRVFGSVEGTLALGPDLVVIADYTSAEMSSLLMAAGAVVVRLNPVRTFADVGRNIELVGRATGEEARARTLHERLLARLRAARALGNAGTVRVLVWGYGNTYSEGCLQDDMITWAGARNAARELGAHGIMPLSPERVITLDPDLIVVTTPEPSARWGEAQRLEGPAWAWVPAVKRGAVLALPAAWLSSVTMHGVLAVEALARALTELGAGGRS
ncbi:MAG TPA: ABC transporter substrate-binding protein [Polyangiaceae bacterium]|jgi:iron complex transport system substrate-binding protein|nr:ABC transporter substrate-binding protein [Polyangiaceae bacterium]